MCKFHLLSLWHDHLVLKSAGSARRPGIIWAQAIACSKIHHITKYWICACKVVLSKVENKGASIVLLCFVSFCAPCLKMLASFIKNIFQIYGAPSASPSIILDYSRSFRGCYISGAHFHYKKLTCYTWSQKKHSKANQNKKV